MNTWHPVTALKNAVRNSPWIVMAVALHLILIAVATVFYTSHEENAVVDRPTTILPPAPRAIVEELKPVEVVVREPIPTEKATQLVEPSEYVRTDEQAAADAEPLGEETGDVEAPPGIEFASTAIGMNPNGPGYRSSRPSGITGTRPYASGKGSKDGKLPPPNDPTDAAVLSGLRWLARHQNEDGSWGATALAERCDLSHKCDNTQAQRLKTYDDGLTSLALLAYLGAGFSHDSKAWFKDPARENKKVVTGEVVKKGLRWLLAHQNPDGSFGDRPFMYNQALAAMALAEAYGLTQNRHWRDPAQRAIDYLAGAQRPDPNGKGLWGWRYASRQEIEHLHMGDSLDDNFKKELYDADTSVTGWAVMALKSAEMAGLNVADDHLNGALAFAKYVSVSDGMAGYIDPRGAGAKVTGPDDHFEYHPAGMSALSMCIRAFAAHDMEDPFLEPAAKRLVADLPRVSKDKLSVDYYYWYYGSLALFQFDGPDSPRARGNHWKAWNKAMIGALLDLQTKGNECGEGGWLTPDRWCHSGGPIYATAINVLTLEVYYRYQNAFSAKRERKSVPTPPTEGAQK